MTDRFDEIGRALAPAEQDADWKAMDLREQADLDPPPGCPLKMSDGREVDPGAWYDLRDWAKLPPHCPVIPLGRTRGSSWFLDARGDIAELKDSSSGKGPIGGLFAGRSRYLEWAWPRYGKPPKGGGRGPVVGWEADDARQALTDAAAFMGTYDPDRMHGRGAWRDDAGRLTYHAGDRVFVNAGWRAPGRHGDWIYPARPPLVTPDPSPVPDLHGPLDDLRQVLQTWNWRRAEVDVQLLLGWIAMAWISGALDWRSMLFVTGEKGCGKSTLLKVISMLFSWGLLKASDPTGAYLYQKLGHDSIPVLIDELEAAAGQSQHKVMKIVELIRQASSGDKVGRGSSEGIALEFECRSAFLCGAINKPPMRQQDQSRFAVLQLDPFETAEADAPIPWDKLKGWGRQILRRMLDGWERWPRTLRAFKAALIEQGGHDARGADQFGALLAAAHIAEFDHDPTPAVLKRWATLLKAEALDETATKTEDWRECLAHLMDKTPDGLRNREAKLPNVGARLAGFRASSGALNDLENILPMLGLTLSFPKGQPEVWENARLFIPASHPETRRTFAGTTWEGAEGTVGVWHSTLQRAPRDMIWPDQCGRGLDRKRHGVMVQLARAFPEVEGD